MKRAEQEMAREPWGQQVCQPQRPGDSGRFDPWTVVSSLVKAGYLKLYEKYPTWSGEGPIREKGCEGCVFRQVVREENGEEWLYCKSWEEELDEKMGPNCPYVTHGVPYVGYHEVKPDEIPDPATWKPSWVPVTERKKEYIGFRKE